jgi:hypothetical protein
VKGCGTESIEQESRMSSGGRKSCKVHTFLVPVMRVGRLCVLRRGPVCESGPVIWIYFRSRLLV